MTNLLALVLVEHAVELVGEQVDGGVHGVGFAIGEMGGAAGVDLGFHLVQQFGDAENHMDLEVSVRVPIEAIEFGGQLQESPIATSGNARHGIEIEHLFEDKYEAVLPASHPLALRQSIGLQELHEENFITNGLCECGPCLKRELNLLAMAVMIRDEGKDIQAGLKGDIQIQIGALFPSANTTARAHVDDILLEKN